MKTLVVGDLHGRLEIAQRALDTDYPVVFIGDYLDSFNRSVNDQVETLKLVLDAAGEERCTALMGNHEMSYVHDSHRCSGFKAATHMHVKHMDLSALKDYVFVEGFLISHAGVSQRLLDYFELTLDEYLDSNNFEQVGCTRGGRYPVGGLRWCDWRDEFAPIADQPQIVGHTRGKIIRQKGNSYCIDVLEDDSNNVALIDNGELEVVDLMKL